MSKEEEIYVQKKSLHTTVLGRNGTSASVESFQQLVRGRIGRMVRGREDKQ